MIARRHWLQQLGRAAGAAVLGRFPSGFAAEIPEAGDASAAVGELARGFMQRFEAPAFSIAYGRAGKITHQAAFGFAEPGVPAVPGSLFRIASVTKPITSATIFTLIEQGRLQLADQVFGDHGVLGFDFGRELPGAIPEITIDHLLTHTGGGWANDGNDPMFLHPAFDHAQLIRWTLAHQPLTQRPGEAFAYSNFGYCVLGRVIEKITGQKYGPYVRQNLLSRCGSENMRIAGNTLAQRALGEVTYRAPGGGNPYGMNVTRMDSHGGWLGTAADLVRFAMHVDTFDPTREHLLRPETVKLMDTPTAASGHYAHGWSVNEVPNWWHNGSLPGTSAILVRTSTGWSWAGLVSTRGEGIGPALDQLMWKILEVLPKA